MGKQTAMQELITVLGNMPKPKAGCSDYERGLYDSSQAVKVKANELLELEKDQLIGSMVGVLMDGHKLKYGITYLGKLRDAEDKAERHFNEAFAANIPDDERSAATTDPQ